MVRIGSPRGPAKDLVLALPEAEYHDAAALLRTIAALLYPEGDTRRPPMPDVRTLGRLRTDLWQLAELLDRQATQRRSPNE